MLGAIIGDIVGSVHEFKSPATKTKDFGPLFITKKGGSIFTHSQYTDDSVCTLAIAEWLMNKDKPVDYHLRKLCNHHIGRGYGAMFNGWLKDASLGAYNSWGNGAPMRVSPVAYVSKDIHEVFNLAEQSAVVTHNHPEAIKGAKFVSGFIFLTQNGLDKEQAVKFLVKALDKGQDYERIIDSSLDSIRPTYKFDVSTQGTVPVAVRCVLEANDFEDAIRNAISCGGDADTLAAIAGSMAESIYAISDDISREALNRLPGDLQDIVIRFFKFIVK